MDSVIYINFSKQARAIENYEQKSQERANLRFLPSQLTALKRLYEHPHYKNVFSSCSALDSNDFSRIVLKGKIKDCKFKLIIAKTLSPITDINGNKAPLKALYYCNVHTELTGKPYNNRTSKSLVSGSQLFIDIPSKIRQELNQMMRRNTPIKNNLLRMKHN